MKYIYEFIGTFFLVLTVGMTVLDSGIGPWAPLAIGSALAVMIFAGAHISGGHYNPAVSLAAYLRKKLAFKDLCQYWCAQIAAAIIGAYVTLFFKGEQVVTPIDLHMMKAFIAEFLFTFALCYVVLNVATAKETSGNSYFGWAIGFTVMVGTYVVGPISGAAFNPAVALGLSILHLTSWTSIWLYIAANLLGAAVAAYVVNEAHVEKKLLATDN